jgi:hypothetical protein
MDQTAKRPRHRPPVLPTEYEKLYVKVPVDIAAAVRDLARAERRSITAQLIVLVERALQEQPRLVGSVALLRDTAEPVSA